MLGQGLLLAALTLPATLSLGVWLPALSRRFGLNGTRLYAANSLGAAFGGLLYARADSAHRQRGRPGAGGRAVAADGIDSAGGPAAPGWVRR